MLHVLQGHARLPLERGGGSDRLPVLLREPSRRLQRACAGLLARQSNFPADPTQFASPAPAPPGPPPVPQVEGAQGLPLAT